MLVHDAPPPGNFAQTHGQAKFQRLTFAVGINVDATSYCGSEANVLAANNLHVAKRKRNVRLRIQIDFGVGDVIVPGPRMIEYPVFPGGDTIQLLAYPIESAIAEKLQAMVALGAANSRMKDFYDVWICSHHLDFETGTLLRAVGATFKNRETPVSVEEFEALTANFAQVHRVHWNAFVKKIGEDQLTDSFGQVVDGLKNFIVPVFRSLVRGEELPQQWKAGKGREGMGSLRARRALSRDLYKLQRRYGRPRVLSDPFHDNTPASLRGLLSKADSELRWGDFRTLLGPHLPAGSYEEVAYFLPLAFDYIRAERGVALDLCSRLAIGADSSARGCVSPSTESAARLGSSGPRIAPFCKRAHSNEQRDPKLFSDILARHGLSGRHRVTGTSLSGHLQIVSSPSGSIAVYRLPGVTH